MFASKISLMHLYSRQAPVKLSCFAQSVFHRSFATSLELFDFVSVTNQTNGILHEMWYFVVYWYCCNMPIEIRKHTWSVDPSTVSTNCWRRLPEFYSLLVWTVVLLHIAPFDGLDVSGGVPTSFFRISYHVLSSPEFCEIYTTPSSSTHKILALTRISSYYSLIRISSL